jgi:hypothetical protein
MYKWKAEHYCNVSADLKYKERFGGGWTYRSSYAKAFVKIFARGLER